MKRKDCKIQNLVYKFFLICFFILLCTLLYIGLSPVVLGIDMSSFAASRNTVKTTLTASRGTIYDSNGDVLAQNMSSYTVIAYLSDTRTGSSNTLYHVEDIEGTAKALSSILNMTEESLIELLSREVYQVELGPGGRNISELVKAEIEALNLPGIDFVESYVRTYPNGDFASYIVGYAKTDDDDVIYGELGIEAKYDDLLTGVDGYLEYQQDRFGYKIPDTAEIRVDAVDGYDVYLTLDSNIQRFLETSVKEVAETYDPEWVQITVMDANTGEILGSSTSPSFDPNIRDITNYENPLISYVYEPGSVMKTFTYMCAIENGVYDGDYTFTSGAISIYDDVITDWNTKGFGTITLDKGFEYSSNVGIVTIMDTMLSKEQLSDCFTSYGFGSTTGIELTRELSGNVTFTYPIEVAAAGYGQGITTTAIQQLQALTILSNDGKMITPSIVDKIVDPNTGEIIYENELVETEALVSQDTIDKVKELLYNTINNTDTYTTGKNYSIEGYDIIGKTGTAQIFDNDSGKYLTGSNDYVYSFAGMYPYEDPEYIIYAAIKQPSYGTSTTLYEPVKEILQNIATYSNMFEEQSLANAYETITLESYISADVLTTSSYLEKLGIEVLLLGDGDTIINQYPSKGTSLIDGDRVIFLTNYTQLYMPSLIGLSSKEAAIVLDYLDISYSIEGYGYVTTQSVLPETLILKETEVVITLEDKYIN